MKIDTTAPRLPINRLKHPLKHDFKTPEKPEDLLFGNKEGEDLDRVVRRLYRQKLAK